MCQCTPSLRTPWCSKGNCKPPEPEPKPGEDKPQKRIDELTIDDYRRAIRKINIVF